MEFTGLLVNVEKKNISQSKSCKERAVKEFVKFSPYIKKTNLGGVNSTRHNAHVNDFLSTYITIKDISTPIGMDHS